MAQIQKYRMPLNIDAIPVYISETSETESQYFGVQNIPDQFHAGKNYFLISGTSKLEPNTNVLIEIKKDFYFFMSISLFTKNEVSLYGSICDKMKKKI